MDSEPAINTFATASPSEEMQAMLDCLREAVAEALERKRRLGQYWVEWTPEGIQLVGEDAPVQFGSNLYFGAYI